MNTERKLGSVAIVGCGAVARQIYATTLPRMGGIRVAYVCDTNERAAESLAQVMSAQVADLDTACRNVDTVIVATPPGTHGELVRKCISLGAHVVCEKPFVGDPAEAEDLVAVAARNSRRLRVGHFRRTFPSVALARNLISCGALGAVRSVRVAEGGRFTWDAASGYVTRDLLGGVLFDTGSHAIDLALFISGWDERKFDVEVDTVRRDRPEPSHEITTTFRVTAGEESVAWDVRLSRYEPLANKVRIGLERAVIDVSVGPRDRFRLTTRDASCVIPVQGFEPNLLEYFPRQWDIVLRPGSDTIFDARRFVGLTRILATVAEAGT